MQAREENKCEGMEMQEIMFVIIHFLFIYFIFFSFLFTLQVSKRRQQGLQWRLSKTLYEAYPLSDVNIILTLIIHMAYAQWMASYC